MALDIIARAAAASAGSSAAAAQAAATGALAAAAPPFLFTAITTKTVDAAVSTIASSGYSAAGKGAASYVSDATATAALASAHPRFCKQSANGRYFRLVPSGVANAISVEQGGAVGSAGTDDRPAIQAAIDYAIATGIGEVLFTQKSYTAKPNTRVEGGFGNINPTGNMIEINGSLASAPFTIKLTGMPGGTTIRKIGYNTGASPDTDYQTVTGNPHRGGGIQLYGTQNNETDISNMDLWKIQCFEMENITIDGGRTAGGKVANSTDTSDKGIFTFNAVRRIVLRDGGVQNFGHELLYGGGGGYGSGTLYPMEVLLENFNALHSNHSCLNFQDANMIVIGGEYGDAYIAAEQYGLDARFAGSVFRDANQLNFAAADRSVIPSGQSFTFPAQGTNLRQTILSGVTCRNVDSVDVGPYTRGDLQIIDGHANFGAFAMSIDLKLTMVLDQTNHQAGMILQGPDTLPTGAAAGLVPKDITIDMQMKTTPHARSLGYEWGGAIAFGGYLEPDTCQITISATGTMLLASTNSGTIRAMPRIVWNGWTPVSAVTQVVPGSSIGGVTSGAIDATLNGMTAYPAGTTGGENMTFATLGSGGAYEGFAQGQEFHFYFGNSSGRFNFAKNGAGMALTRTRVCFAPGDHITFVYDKRLDKWVDVGGHTSDILEASATYDAPGIAAGGSTSTTVTVTGAAIGDSATASLGLSTAGLIVSATVTAANTVTVVLANLTGAAVDLASTTLAVTVTRR